MAESKPTPLSDERLAEIIEIVAAWDHKAWANWTEWMLDRLTTDNIVRWRRQIATEYADLSEGEKESDRKEAREVIALILSAQVLDPYNPYAEIDRLKTSHNQDAKIAEAAKILVRATRTAKDKLKYAANHPRDGQCSTAYHAALDEQRHAQAALMEMVPDEE